MRYTIALQLAPQRALIAAEAGRVDFNGQKLMPHEAAMLAQALEDCAERAEDMAAELAAKLQPEALAA